MAEGIMLHSKEDKPSTPLECSEIEIPVPWGHISAKVWGETSGRPLLAVHGLQDNAGTFDRLIPFLPRNLYIVCIDLPGHGRSSHFPPGFVLHYVDYILSIRRVADFLNWKKFYYLGHSYGAQIGAYFCAFYPQYVTKLIMLDAVSTFLAEDVLDRFAKIANLVLKKETQMAGRTPPFYEYEEALNRMLNSRMSTLTDDAAKALIKRSLVRRNGGYGFSIDQRLKGGVWVPWNSNQNVIILEKIKCPQLIIIAKESLPVLSKAFSKEMMMFKSRRNFSYIVVDGNHDVHNNSPEIIAPTIKKFLGSLKSSF